MKLPTIKRAVFLVTPHAGGTFSVFLALKKALSGHGITLEWLGYSHDPDALPRDPRLAGHLETGHLIDSRGMTAPDLGQALLSRLTELDYDLAFINVLTNPGEMALAAYLPPKTRRIMLVHNVTPGTYAAARAVRPFVHATVGVSPRIREELIASHGFQSDSTYCVLNAIDLPPMEGKSRAPTSSQCRLVFLGRVVNIDKGVFQLPKLMAQLPEARFHLTVAGDGPDLATLKQRSKSDSDRIEFLGRVGGQEVPQLMAAHDILVMPSRFEGFGYTLIEAMAQHCVPVASLIRGVTDVVVEHERTGLLVPIGDVRGFARAIRRLADDSRLYAALSAECRGRVEQRFSTVQMAQAYKPILDRLGEGVSEPATRFGHPFKTLPVGGQWRKFVPQRVKNALRRYL